MVPGGIDRLLFIDTRGVGFGEDTEITDEYRVLRPSGRIALIGLSSACEQLHTVESRSS
jgi:hypothetical protein